MKKIFFLLFLEQIALTNRIFEITDTYLSKVWYTVHVGYVNLWNFDNVLIISTNKRALVLEQYDMLVYGTNQKNCSNSA